MSDKYLGFQNEGELSLIQVTGFSGPRPTNEADFIIGLISLDCNVVFHEYHPY